MPSTQLPNYLKANRKRLALSQREVSYLLGAKGEAKVCRYERFIREPSLQTALACEVIFQRPISELFGGLLQKIEQEVATRAAELVETAFPGKPNRRTHQKRTALETIAARHSKTILNS